MHPDVPAPLPVRKQLSLDPADCKEFSESKYVLLLHLAMKVLLCRTITFALIHKSTCPHVAIANTQTNADTEHFAIYA